MLLNRDDAAIVESVQISLIAFPTAASETDGEKTFPGWSIFLNVCLF